MHSGLCVVFTAPSIDMSWQSMSVSTESLLHIAVLNYIVTNNFCNSWLAGVSSAALALKALVLVRWWLLPGAVCRGCRVPGIHPTRDLLLLKERSDVAW